LQRVCDGRLSDIRWFRADWQRGGALTGYAHYSDEEGEHEVVVKLPVPPVELRWLRRLQVDDPAAQSAPRLVASGEQVNGYDFAWVVMERLPHGPLDPAWGGDEWDLLADAVGRFYARSAQFPIDQPPREEDWPTILRKARERIRDNPYVDQQRWNQALKAVSKKLKHLLKTWTGRDTSQWCHGDLHLRNAMTRRPAPDGPALLFDLAGVRPGHWVEDAVYLEHLYWAAPNLLHGRDIVKAIGQRRKAHGLSVDSAWPRLADIRRCLLAAATPAYMRNEGDPAHMQAALGMLENVCRRLNIAK
jgi:hypothetical protein